MRDPQQVAKLYKDALMMGDAGAVMRLSSPDEFRMNGMSEDDVSAFLNGWLRPKLVRALDDRDISAVGEGSSGFQTYHLGVVTSAGRLNLPITVAETDDGLKVVQGLTSIVVIFATVRADGRFNTGGADKLLSYAHNAPRLARELAPYKLTKIRVRPEHDPMTIEEFGLWSAKRYRLLTQK